MQKGKLRDKNGNFKFKMKKYKFILLLGCFKLRNRNIINKIRLKRFEIKLDFLAIIKFRVLIGR